jgi:sensor histidine kinase YesM
LIILAAWSLFGFYMAAQDYFLSARFGQGIPFVRALVSEMVYAYLWAALTPLVLMLGRKFRIERTSLGRTLPLHVIASGIVALLHRGSYGIIIGFYRSVYESTPITLENQLRSLLSFLDYGILLYWMILVLDYAFDYYRKYREKELKASQLQVQLAQAQLQSLRMQLHPHFLFNTLNAISVLIQKNPESARQTLGRLSDLLRLTLDYAADQLVPLSTELEFLDRYLKIEQTRFEDRLAVEMHIDPEVLNARVPNLILQPLVENAIKHGVNQQIGPAVIGISAHRLNGELRLEVRDNGKGLVQEGRDRGREGIGLSNTRARLQQLYGNHQRLEVVEAAQGGVIATVDIPYSAMDEVA